MIVTFDSAEFLRSAPEALRDSDDISSVTIADNASADNSVEVALSLGWGVPAKVVASATNRGFGAAVNAAVKAIEHSSEYTLILNPDAYISHQGLATLVADLDDDPRLACVGAHLRRSDGSAVASARAFPTPLSLARRRITEVDHHGALTSADWVSGALMLWRRTAFNEVGGFSSDFFLYFEDTDICRRAQALGWQVAIDGRVGAVHNQGHGKTTTPNLRRHSRESRRCYARRWFGLMGLAASAVADAQEIVVSGLRTAGLRR